MANTKQNPYIIPGAIVVAGFLIAGAVIYSQSADPQRLLARPGVTPAPEAPNAGVRIDMAAIDLENWPSKGDLHAPILIVEYSDFACPFCARFYETTLPQLREVYIDTGKVRFVYKNFISVGGQNEAEAAHCAREQGKFWEYHSVLSSRFNADREARRGNIAIYLAYAQELGLNTNDFRACLEGRRFQGKVNDSTQEGQRNGITGTPSFLINGRLVVGAQPFQVFQQIIEQELGNL